MSTNITAAFEKVLKDKTVPLKPRTLSDGNIAYDGTFDIAGRSPLGFGVVLENKPDVCDYQIMFNELARLKSYEQKEAVLEKLNELNIVDTGYYTLILGNDGEIFMKTLGRTTTNVQALYEILVYGTNIAKKAQEALIDFLASLN